MQSLVSIFLCLSLIFSLAASAEEGLAGVWQLKKTLCQKNHEANPPEVDLFKLPIATSENYRFRPDVELTIASVGTAQASREYRIQKKVKESSCPDKRQAVDAPALIVSEYVATSMVRQWQGRQFVFLRSSQPPSLANIAHHIDYQRISNCGPSTLGWALEKIISWSFPDYFLREAGRQYHGIISDQGKNLALRFVDVDICEGTTIMMFQRKN